LKSPIIKNRVIAQQAFESVCWPAASELCSSFPLLDSPVGFNPLFKKTTKVRRGQGITV
jgi:hypothetical protein